MKSKKVILIIILAVVFIGFTNCDLDNPIMRKWWEPDEPDFIFVNSLVKDVPTIVYETIYETIYTRESFIYDLPPEIVMQRMTIIDIQFILFSGDSITFNGPPVSPSVSAITPQTMDVNDKVIESIATLLKNNPTWMVMLHGHANPVGGASADNIADLMNISEKRAKDVERVLKENYRNIPVSNNLADSRIIVNWYGGHKNLVTVNSPIISEINRRVEVILFVIETQ